MKYPPIFSYEELKQSEDFLIIKFQDAVYRGEVKLGTD